MLLRCTAEDVERTREVYRACLKLIPHRAFTFSKIWIMAAQFEIRQLRLDAARKILGMGIGMCPKVGAGSGLGADCRTCASHVALRMWRAEAARCCSWCKAAAPPAAPFLCFGFWRSLDWCPPLNSQPPLHPTLPQDKLFKSYIEMELQLGAIERCRTLYQKYIEWSPANAGAWGRCGHASVQGGDRSAQQRRQSLRRQRPVGLLRVRCSYCISWSWHHHTLRLPYPSSPFLPTLLSQIC
jgi:crooked neck